MLNKSSQAHERISTMRFHSQKVQKLSIVLEVRIVVIFRKEDGDNNWEWAQGTFGCW